MTLTTTKMIQWAEKEKKKSLKCFTESWMLFQSLHLVNYLAQMIVITQCLQRGCLKILA